MILQELNSQLSSLDLFNFNTSKVTDMNSMFQDCSKLSSLNLSNFNTSIVTNMGSMFYGCSQLSSINLSNFNTLKVRNMHSMFRDCSHLTSLNLSNFVTSNLRNMGIMFQGCSQLSSLNLSNFDTSQVTYMRCLFYYCYQLSELDLSNFNTSNVEDMAGMFLNNSKLSSLNLSHFDTSKVKDMIHMFYNCSQLSSLDLSNFDTSQVTDMNHMFYRCIKLEYINLKNFIEKDSLNVTNIFKNVPDNIVACLNENSNKIKKEITNNTCYTLDCSDNWKINQKKIVNKTDVCYDIFNNGILYKYEYQGLYYENCINGNITNNLTINYCHCDNQKCLYCSKKSLIHDLCIDCNNDYYEKEDDDNTFGYKKCHRNPIGYYLDINDKIYKKCYYSCEKCENKGNDSTHNCTKCSNNYPKEFIVNNNLNCYQNCIYYYYFDIYKNYQCTINGTCPDEYPIQDGMECKKLGNKIENVLQNLLNNEETKKEEIKYYDTICKNIEDILTSKNYNTSYLDTGNDEIIEMEKMKVTFTTTENQKNNINSDTTNIDLGECESSLRQFYNLSNDSVIYIKMLEVSQDEMRIPKVEYDIFAKINGENLMKLNLSSCKNNKISLSIPVDNIGNIDKLNSSSGYYNDICYTATSDSGTDISLIDRKNEFPSM